MNCRRHFDRGGRFDCRRDHDSRRNLFWVGDGRGDCHCLNLGDGIAGGRLRNRWLLDNDVANTSLDALIPSVKLGSSHGIRAL